ncbi:MAG: elongation factor Ts [Candidatus Omnitrophica bacterium]|nr:elongation factor Ts [Candidatus Omnitrophota bacterium]
MSVNIQNTKADLIKLRELTGAGMADCNSALKEANGDVKTAQDLIRKRGLDIAKKKSSREAKEGVISTYIHSGAKLGVMVEINCESDFVARNEIFQAFVKDIAMQIAAAHPLYVRADDIPADVLEKEKSMFAEEVKGKPEAIREKVLEGKMSKRFEDICLLNQKFIKDDSKTIDAYISDTIAKLGENIVIRRFVRFEVGGAA